MSQDLAPGRGIGGEVVRQRRHGRLVPEVVRVLARQRDLRARPASESVTANQGIGQSLLLEQAHA